ILVLFRSVDFSRYAFGTFVTTGHSGADMLDMINLLLAEAEAWARPLVQCKQLIISGGLRSFLDGYYLTEKVNLPAVYGQASAFLRYAREDYATLARYVKTQIQGLELAKAYLRPRL
ncbi:MAG: isopentenyl-diphosphate delta-isomerase, partial [Bacteroidota bacterium]